MAAATDVLAANLRSPIAASIASHNLIERSCHNNSRRGIAIDSLCLQGLWACVYRLLLANDNPINCLPRSDAKAQADHFSMQHVMAAGQGVLINEPQLSSKVTIQPDTTLPNLNPFLKAMPN